MNLSAPLLITLWLWLGTLVVPAQETAPKTAATGPPPALAASQGVGEQAKREGWQSACLAVDLIHVQETFPGLTAWLEDFKQADEAVTAVGEHGVFPDLKIDDLLSKNPNFWAAFYEVLPGDPGLGLLHAGLLLAGGEAQRASTIATLALQRPGVPDAFRKSLLRVASRAFAAQSAAITLTTEGVALHDQEDFSGALEKYDAALKLWPSQGWTLYERGFTLQMMALKKGKKQGAEDAAKLVTPPEAMRSFAKARQHDPLQIPAYLGAGPAQQKARTALEKKVRPAWIKLEENVAHQLTDAELQALAEGFQEAGIHDYALVAHGVVVARRGKYVHADLVWISESLAEMAPGQATEKALQKLEDKELRCLTIVPIEAPKAPAQKSD